MLIEGSPLGCSWLSFAVLSALLCIILGSPLRCSRLSFGVLSALLLWCSRLSFAVLLALLWGGLLFSIFFNFVVLILRSIFAPFMQLSIMFARILSGIILFSSVFDFNFRFILSVPLEPPLKVNICFQFLFSTCFGAVCRKNCWYCSSAFDLSLCCFLF